MRVLLVDDDPECLEACAAELREAGHEVTAVASFETMRLKFAGAGTEIAVLDLEVPGESSSEAMQWLRQQDPGLPIVALTAHASDDYLFAALAAGAVGYVLKHDALGSLTRVVADVAQGGSPMTPRIARRILEAFHSASAPAVDAAMPPASTRAAATSAAAVSTRAAPVVAPLEEASDRPTQREIEVLQALAKGLTYQECGSVLDIRVDTVRSHVRNIYRKLQVTSKAEAVVTAWRRGWLI